MGFNQKEDEVIYDDKDNNYKDGLTKKDSQLFSESGGKKSNSLAGIVFIVVSGLLIYYLFLGEKKKGEKEEKKDISLVTNTSTDFNKDDFLPKPKPEKVFREEKQRIKLPPLPITVSLPLPPPQVEEKKEDPVLLRRMKKGGFVKYSNSAISNKGNSTSSEFNAEQEQEKDESFLASKYAATKTPKATAEIIKNPSLTLGKGTIIPCTLETEIKSDLPGLVTCIINHDVYSMDSQIILAERGTKVIGEYQNGITQGQTSLFILWTQIRTPNHVIIDINSPAAGRLGAAGTQGYVDNKFWERFGAAIMFSAFNLAIDIGVQKTQEDVKLEGTAEYTREIIGAILEQTINIPPTLYKTHGEQVNIILARDLAFASVYGLKK